MLSVIYLLKKQLSARFGSIVPGGYEKAQTGIDITHVECDIGFRKKFGIHIKHSGKGYAVVGIADSYGVLIGEYLVTVDIGIVHLVAVPLTQIVLLSGSCKLKNIEVVMPFGENQLTIL